MELIVHPFQQYERKEIRKDAIDRSGIAVSWACWVKVEEKEPVLRVEALDDRYFGSYEVGIASALIEVGHFERLHCRHDGNDGAQELVNMPWQVWLSDETG
jgi:hypothetical protein